MAEHTVKIFDADLGELRALIAEMVYFAAMGHPMAERPRGENLLQTEAR